jgi:hypothetical protein
MDSIPFLYGKPEKKDSTSKTNKKLCICTKCHKPAVMLYEAISPRSLFE